MATRAERFRADEQRHRSKRAKKKQSAHKTKEARSKKSAGTHENVHAAHKATAALEEHEPGKRPSRKSTRKSANRSKPSSTLDVRETMSKNTADARARKK